MVAFAQLCAYDLTMQQIYDGNDVHLKIFVFEYVTGGGLYREPLPPSLVGEGELMLLALLSDLSTHPGVELLTMRDARLPALNFPVASVAPAPDFEASWAACLAASDAVWLIAPETGGVLERLSAMVVAAGKRLLGCLPDAVAVTASKYATSRWLGNFGLPVVKTFRPSESLPEQPSWVAKPDDGAGCSDTRHFSCQTDMRRWLAEGDRMATHIVQPALSGEAASLSMLCLDGRAWLLSCNRQIIALQDGVYSYHGSVLNGMAQHWQNFSALADGVALALPGLAGYIGVDLMVMEDDITVLEINPRLTTSYAGLRQAIECNPAALVLDLFYNDCFNLPQTLTRKVVEVSLE